MADCVCVCYLAQLNDVPGLYSYSSLCLGHWSLLLVFYALFSFSSKKQTKKNNKKTRNQGRTIQNTTGIRSVFYCSRNTSIQYMEITNTKRVCNEFTDRNQDLFPVLVIAPELDEVVLCLSLYLSLLLSNQYLDTGWGEVQSVLEISKAFKMAFKLYLLYM